MYRVGIDIGGTFTDMLLVGEDGSAVIGKTLTKTRVNGNDVAFL